MASFVAAAPGWHGFWHGEIGVWILDKGLRITLLVLGAVLASRMINWTARTIARRYEAEFKAGDALVRSEASKHRQAVAAVISWGAIVLLSVVVAVQITNIIDVPVGSLAAPRPCSAVRWASVPKNSSRICSAGSF